MSASCDQLNQPALCYFDFSCSLYLETNTLVDHLWCRYLFFTIYMCNLGNTPYAIGCTVENVALWRYGSHRDHKKWKWSLKASSHWCWGLLRAMTTLTKDSVPFVHVNIVVFLIDFNNQHGNDQVTNLSKLIIHYFFIIYF